MDRVRSSLLTALLAVAGLLFAACGDDDTGATDADDTEATDVDDEATDTDDEATDDEAASADLPDPCGLLTVADLQSATGVGFAEGEFNEQLSNDLQSICDWVSDEPFATAQVLVNRSGITFEDQRASVEDAFGEETADVDLSVPAYQTVGGDIVAMQVDDLFVQVAYLPSDAGTDASAATVQMAETVLENLG